MKKHKTIKKYLNKIIQKKMKIKIKRVFRTYEGAMNRIRLNNIRWMERNVLAEVTE